MTELVGITEPIIAAVDNGGTNTRVTVRQGQNELGSEEYRTPQDYETAVTELGRVASELSGQQKINAVGFAVAGKVESGMIVSAGELQSYGWCLKPFAADVAEELRIDPEAVVLLNDCVAAAKAQQVFNRKSGRADSGYIETISTGFGGAGFSGDELIPDEPGHVYLKPGAVCGCGKHGCVEAHISGSGINRKYGLPAEHLPAFLWTEVVKDATAAHIDMMHRFQEMGFEPKSLHFFGSVAVKSEYMLPGLKRGLAQSTHQLPFLPEVVLATYGDRSGIVGAGDAALELVTSS